VIPRSRISGTQIARSASAGLGMRLLRIAPGEAEIAMVVEAHITNGHGICHGGCGPHPPL